MSLEKNLQIILDQIGETAVHAGRNKDDIILVAVTKGRSVEEIKEAYNLGLRDFAENRVAEALGKMAMLPTDIRWHFIGKLQTNKIPKVLGKFALIHSIDTVELAEKLARASLAKGLTTSVLLEANISGETSKSGLTPLEWVSAYSKLLELKGIEIDGLMTMAPFTNDEASIRSCFSHLRRLSLRLQRIGGDMSTLSMGMTHDFRIAIQEGATLVRIGTALFTPQWI